MTVTAPAPGDGGGWHIGELSATAMRALATQPLLLAMVLLNGLLILLFYWASNDTRTKHYQTVRDLIEHCSRLAPRSELLPSVPPTKMNVSPVFKK